MTRSLYEDVLQAAAGRPLLAPRPPRASASVVLWRRRGSDAAGGGGGVEVFWIKRAETMAFMGGWHAFPGGGLSRRDAGARVVGVPAGGDAAVTAAAMPETLTDGLWRESGGSPPPHLVDGLVACALRELLEETGVLPLPELAPGSDSAARGDHLDGADLEVRLGAARAAVLDRRPLAEVAEQESLTLDASRLVFAGRWLTPPLGPMRFDNRFFLLEWPPGLPIQPLVLPGEAEHGEWIEPAAAYDRWRRGEVITAPPILHLLKVLAEEGPEAGLARLREPEEVNLGPYRKIEFRPGVVLIPQVTATLPPAGHTNAYLLGRRELVLIDPGSGDPDQLDRLVAALAAAEEGGAEVSAIWLTHHHPDHVAGVAPLAERLGLPVAAHPATADRLADSGIEIDRHFQGGEEIVLAGDPPFPVKVIHTPGHARGHLCFYDVDGKSLIAGDMLSTLSTIVIDPPEGDMDAYLASLQRLIGLAPSTLFPSHGPPIKNAVDKLEELIGHRQMREDLILAAWKSGLKTPAALRPQVYDDIPEMAYPLAERQIAAHLERLERTGRLQA